MKILKLNKFHSFFVIIATIIILSITTTAWSASIWKTGTVTRTLTDTQYYGGCMVLISTPIANGCPNNGWVSLDCDGTYSQAGEGQRAYASALVALSLGKQVSILVNTTQKHNGYCVARRLDIIP